jgi:hypothetical protein
VARSRSDLPTHLEPLAQPVIRLGERAINVARGHAEPGVDVVRQLGVQD